MRYAHTNLVANDWKKLAQFYIDVFQCAPQLPERNYSGKWIDKALDLEQSKIQGIHLLLPGYSSDNTPTLEIFQYSPAVTQKSTYPNTPGFAHIAFVVEEVSETAKEIIAHGGTALGALTEKEVPAGKLTFQYMRDPEGNIVEIQSWD